MRLIDADALIEAWGLQDCVKYGNETAEQQYHSYSSMMLYEIKDMIDDAPTIDAVEVVRCKDCVYHTLSFINCEGDTVATCNSDYDILMKQYEGCPYGSKTTRRDGDER